MGKIEPRENRGMYDVLWFRRGPLPPSPHMIRACACSGNSVRYGISDSLFGACGYGMIPYIARASPQAPSPALGARSASRLASRRPRPGRRDCAIHAKAR